MADRIRPLCFLVFTDSLKLVESSHLHRKLVAAKLHALCTGKYRNDKLMKEALLLLQRVGENRPAMNASFRAGNNGSDARDGTRARWLGLALFYAGQHRDLEIVSMRCQSS